jgi:hypothetical protein
MPNEKNVIMKTHFLVIFTVLGLLFSGCSTQRQAQQSAASTELKRVTQLDVTTNQPVKSWNAHVNTIHQHVTPPVGISFTDADTGEEVHFEGTYKIESYRKPTSSPNEAAMRNSRPEPTPAEGH